MLNFNRVIKSSIIPINLQFREAQLFHYHRPGASSCHLSKLMAIYETVLHPT